MRWHDWLLVACALALVVIGPVMALQEVALAQEQQANLVILGQLPAQATEFRLAWRLPLTVLVLVSSILGAFAAIRVLMDPLVRAVSTRVLVVLLVALALFDVAYWLDGAVFLEAPYLLRAATVVWLYPIAGVLIAGSIRRIAQLQDYFGETKAADFKL